MTIVKKTISDSFLSLQKKKNFLPRLFLVRCLSRFRLDFKYYYFIGNVTVNFNQQRLFFILKKYIFFLI